MFKCIIMMTDLTETSRRAFTPIADLAHRDADTRVILAHSVIGSTERYFLDDTIRQQIDTRACDNARPALEAMAADLRALDVNVEVALEVGSPFNVLPDLVHRFGAQLVVLPTRSEHSLVRRISNSVTGRAIRDHEVPVLTINDHFDPTTWKGFGPVVHPVAFGERQRSGLVAAEDIAEATGSELQLVHVLQPLNIASIYDDSERELARVVEKSQDELMIRLEKEMATVCAGVTRTKAQSCVLTHDNAGVGIVNYVASAGAGLVVLPALGRDAVHTQLMGSVAEHVIRYATCPVLIYDRPLFN